jgi:tRNA pseudouridine55 synthase
MKARVHGLLVLDKPSGLTSRDVVNRVQRWWPRGTRIGHTGTLDPLATGVLVLCLGDATRLTEYVQRMAKTYRARLRLGAVSTTDDADGDITNVVEGPVPSEEQLRAGLNQFLGDIDQVPPAFSAAKVTGRRAYDLARQGEEVSLEPRRVTIYGMELLAYEYPHLELEVHCGKGTYIRALTRDLGQQLGCGAYLSALRRTRVGPFTEATALPLHASREQARAFLLPLTSAIANLPKLVMDEAQLQRLRYGQAVPASGFVVDEPLAEIAVVDEAGNLAAIVRLDQEKRLVPQKVLALERTKDEA